LPPDFAALCGVGGDSACRHSRRPVSGGAVRPRLGGDPAQLIADGHTACDNYGSPGVVAQMLGLEARGCPTFRHRTCHGWRSGIPPRDEPLDAAGLKTTAALPASSSSGVAGRIHGESRIVTSRRLRQLSGPKVKVLPMATIQTGLDGLNVFAPRCAHHAGQMCDHGPAPR
jgi:hypothetical protein